jgi:hypothetical protein
LPASYYVGWVLARFKWEIHEGVGYQGGRKVRVMRKVALLVATITVGGVAGFGFAGAAYASAAPTITTSAQPAAATAGSSIADKATVSGSVIAVSFTCPPVDLAGRSLGQHGTSGSTLACTYQTIPNNFYCQYFTDTGLLRADHDAGMCPPVAVPTANTVTPTGTVTFTLYNNPNGTGTPLFTDTETLSGGTATSKGYTTTATGTDYWVATYNGDGNFGAVSSGAAAEPVTISTATPTISTVQQPASATVGTSIKDQATVSGGDSPTGTVTFTLYGNPNGTGTPLFTDTETLSGGTAASAGYTATAAGTDYWVATYNGDSDNNQVSSGPAAEPVTITALPYLVKLLYTAPAGAKAGSTVPIKIELEQDVNGSLVNVSSASLGVQALCVVPAGTTTCAGAVISYVPPLAFAFVSSLVKGGGYQFNVKTLKTLGAGTYQLLFRISGEPGTAFHADAGATFTIR